MTIKNKHFLRVLREGKGFLQKELAEKIGISRPSYIAIEQGTRDLTLTEAEKLAAVFGISLEDLTNAAIPHYEKYKEMIVTYLCSTSFVGKGIPKTKLAKMLYLADFAWFYEKLQSMSGMQYRKIQFGPVPDAYFRAIDELEDTGIISVERINDSILISCSRSEVKSKARKLLNKDEIRLIEDIAKKWQKARTQEIVHFTHEQLPYKLCSDNELIPYELITQEDPDHVY